MAKPEYTKSTKKACATCHVDAKAPKELKDAGKYYQRAQEPGRLQGKEVVSERRRRGAGHDANGTALDRRRRYTPPPFVKPCPIVARGTWNPVGSPDLSQHCVLVLDQAALERLPLPLANPERIVLITRIAIPSRWPRHGRQGSFPWCRTQDPMSTVLLAIMAAALRVEKSSNLRQAEFPPAHGMHDCAITPRTSKLQDPNAQNTTG